MTDMVPQVEEPKLTPPWPMIVRDMSQAPKDRGILLLVRWRNDLESEWHVGTWVEPGEFVLHGQKAIPPTDEGYWWVATMQTGGEEATPIAWAELPPVKLDWRF